MSAAGFVASLQICPGHRKPMRPLNITTRNIALMTLPRNQLLAIDEVLLQRTCACKPCNRLEEFRPGLRAALEGRRGILARVVRGGLIRRGEHIELL
ncbi:MAG: hypothetical protein WD182_01835 [Bacteroidota bacterium]